MILHVAIMKVDGKYIAHCLEGHFVEEAMAKKECLGKLRKRVVDECRKIAHSLEGDTESIFDKLDTEDFNLDRYFFTYRFIDFLNEFITGDELVEYNIEFDIVDIDNMKKSIRRKVLKKFKEMMKK